MPDDFRVRVASLRDAESIGVIGTAAYAESYSHLWVDADAYSAHLATFGPAATAEFLTRPTTRIWLVGSSARPVGFLSLILGAPDPVEHRTDGAEIPRIYILAPARGNGLAARLLAEAERYARQNGAAHLWLDAMTCAPWAWKTYGRWGFEKIGQSMFPGEVKPEFKTMIVMRRPLDADFQHRCSG